MLCLKVKKMGAMPPSARAAYVAAGGVAGGAAFVLSNMANSYAQKHINSSTNSNDTNKPFSNSVNSVLEGSDSPDTVINFLYFNITTSIIMLCLSIFLIYLSIRAINNIIYI